MTAEGKGIGSGTAWRFYNHENGRQDRETGRLGEGSLSHAKEEDVPLTSRLDELMAALAAEHVHVLESGGIGRQQARDNSRGSAPERLRKPKDRDRAIQPSCIDENFGVRHAPMLAVSQSPSRPGERPTQKSLRRRTLITKPWTPWLITGVLISPRTSEFCQGPFREARRPAPEK